MIELNSKEEEILLEQGQEEYYNFKMPMFYPCPDYSPAAQGEQRTAEKLRK